LPRRRRDPHLAHLRAGVGRLAVDRHRPHRGNQLMLAPTRALAAALSLAFVCASASAAPPKNPPKNPKTDDAAAKKDADPAPAAAADKKPQSEWDAAVAFFKDADQSGWTDAKCQSAADKFVAAVKAKRAEGYYNAGVAMEKCGK